MGRGYHYAFVDILQALINSLEPGHVTLQVSLLASPQVDQLQCVICFERGRIDSHQLFQTRTCPINETGVQILDGEPQSAAESLVSSWLPSGRVEQLSIVLRRS